jgi:UDP-N-acetylglucosamine pyrophosphorylase
MQWHLCSFLTALVVKVFNMEMQSEQIIPYDNLPTVTKPDNLNKLAILKVNGGLGTLMGMRRERRINIRLLTPDIC